MTTEKRLTNIEDAITLLAGLTERSVGTLEGINKTLEGVREDSKQTRAILEGVREDSKQTRAILEGVRKDSKQTRAILEGVREDGKQTRAILDEIRHDNRHAQAVWVLIAKKHNLFDESELEGE